jgi:hypothetical protein
LLSSRAARRTSRGGTPKRAVEAHARDEAADGLAHDGREEPVEVELARPRGARDLAQGEGALVETS